MKMMGIIFANIYDSSLGQLTNKRTMASLPYGGRYRLIDFCLSNMANSNIDHIGIITQYNYQSLMNHVGSAQDWDLEIGEGKLEFLTPYSLGSNSTYRGKLDALYADKLFLELAHEEYVLLADSCVLCSIDYRKVLDSHIKSGRDITMVVADGVSDGKKQLDLAVLLNESNNISDMVVDYKPDSRYLASMGAFIIERKLLLHYLEAEIARGASHLERDFILKNFYNGKLSMNVYRFDKTALYAESPAEYYESNLAMLDSKVRRDLFHSESTIYTRVRNEVPAYIGEHAQVDNCIVGDGCFINGKADHSVLFRGVKLGKDASVKDCVIMQDCIIEEGAVLEHCVLDKKVRVRSGVTRRGRPDQPIIIEREETL